MHDSVVNKVAARTFCLSDVFIHSESILCEKCRATHERPPITRPYQWLRGDRSTRHRSTRDICKFRFFFFFYLYLFIYLFIVILVVISHELIIATMINSIIILIIVLIITLLRRLFVFFFQVEWHALDGSGGSTLSGTTNTHVREIGWPLKLGRFLFF